MAILLWRQAAQKAEITASCCKILIICFFKRYIISIHYILFFFSFMQRFVRWMNSITYNAFQFLLTQDALQLALLCKTVQTFVGQFSCASLQTVFFPCSLPFALLQAIDKRLGGSHQMPLIEKKTVRRTEASRWLSVHVKLFDHLTGQYPMMRRAAIRPSILTQCCCWQRWPSLPLGFRWRRLSLSTVVAQPPQWPSGK